MELILWRHGEAEKAAPNLPDFKRRLNSTGRKQVSRMAEWIKPRLNKKTRILAAPSARTIETVEFLELPYSIVDEIGVGASTADLLAAASWPDGDGPVLLVCHQPTIGRVASLFLLGSEVDMAVKKCGLLWLSGREREHRSEVVLRVAMHPDMV
jgi:phosphohistidine phosphatase